jgi:alpha-L-arabinofuranosidase
MKYPKYIAAMALIAMGLNITEVNAAPQSSDAVELQPYCLENGHSGLRLRWREVGSEKWHSVGNDYDWVKSDFGAWGSGKKMYSLELLRDTIANQWILKFNPDKEKTVVAIAKSADLIKWAPQNYYRTSETPSLPSSAVAVTQVPRSFITNLEGYVHYRKAIETKYDERCDQDAFRFASLGNVSASITAQPAKAKAISDELIGIFFEDINYAADGGLYAELVQNRDFEYQPSDRGNDKNWNAMTAWSLVNPSAISSSIETANPIHANNSHYISLNVNRRGGGVANSGYDGIAVKKGEKYDFSIYARTAVKGGALEVSLLDNGTVIAKTTVNLSSSDWKQYTAQLTAKTTAANAQLVIKPAKVGKYDLDMVSLFPVNTFKGRKNGLRQDLAQTLADLHPRFIRFPGGCVAHGEGIDNIYDWKGSIGSLEERSAKRNLWGYHQSRGLGYYEFFQFCEDINATPVPVLSAGVPCQNSSTPSHYSVDALTTYGQQGGIPLEDMDAYIADILDLIEYANGPATSTWGAKRAAAGHPEPFNLKYIGIGNEDLITEAFETRFNMIFKAIKKAHPEITVIGTVGPFYEGADYDEGWRFAHQEAIPIVDEHYYVAPGWLIHNQDYYENYKRNATRVYLGEYASHLPDRSVNIETALSEALYLTSVERNADVVAMTSYAPLLAKEGHTQWNPDLIYFNNTEVKPTVGYYVQQMYGTNSGDTYIPANVTVSETNDDVTSRIGVSIVKDSKSNDVIVKLVNMLPVEVATTLELSSLTDATNATRTVLTGTPDDKTAKSSTDSVVLNGNYTIPAYSFTVLRLPVVK